MCGIELDADERYCHHCGIRLEESSTSKPQRAHSVIEPSQRTSSIRVSQKLRTLYVLIPLLALMIFASYLLGEYVASTHVLSHGGDESFYLSIFSSLRADPAGYYHIADHFFRIYYYNSAPLWMQNFPLIFYIWLVSPTTQELKWLYFIFALAATISSYFTIYLSTRRPEIAALSGAWIAYFLRTSNYLMIDYWGATLFLVGLPFFVARQHVKAAVIIGIAVLVKQTLAPFMAIAAIYYVWVRRKHFSSFLGYHSHKVPRVPRTISRAPLAYATDSIAWSIGAISVGFAYYVNGLVSQGTFQSPIHNSWGFDPNVLQVLFNGSFFVNPPIPLLLAFPLAIIGLLALRSGQSIIAAVSFIIMPLLMVFETVGTETKIAVLAGAIASRWVLLTILFLNLFWLVGIYEVCLIIYHQFKTRLASV